MFTPNAQFWDVQSHWDHRGMDEHWLFRKDGSGGKKGKLLFMNDINQNVQSSVEEWLRAMEDNCGGKGISLQERVGFQGLLPPPSWRMVHPDK